MRRLPYILSPATSGDLEQVRGLIRDAVSWLRKSKRTDQWEKPWPDRARHHERILNDLIEGKTWLVWDDDAVAGTITLDTEEPLASHGKPVWPTHKRAERALYVRRVIVRRVYAGLGIGAALLDWAASVAMQDHGAALLRIDVWTTNLGLHAYYERQRFTRCPGRDPKELVNYPSQALFERRAEHAGSRHVNLFAEARRPHDRMTGRHIRLGNSHLAGCTISAPGFAAMSTFSISI